MTSGFKPGIQVKFGSVMEPVYFDVESDEFKPWRKTMLSHYAEYTNYDTGEKYWKKFNRQPKTADLYRANHVIRKNEDGTYEYVKNRKTGELRQLTEEEAMWLILKAG